MSYSLHDLIDSNDHRSLLNFFFFFGCRFFGFFGWRILMKDFGFITATAGGGGGGAMVSLMIDEADAMV